MIGKNIALNDEIEDSQAKSGRLEKSKKGVISLSRAQPHRAAAAIDSRGWG